MNKRVDELQIGDVILPPEREMRLWMRRACQERNLPETALHMTVTEICEGNSDKKGRWMIVKSDQSPEWNADRSRMLPFKFKARPETPWPVIA